ncbi:uncharacterized protein [Musca autumnalis]|uniref:uncharacterized protein n=1 Tax=Musca autumnalis TaxID=221902 RepID=UPI003CFA8D7D
MDKVLQSLGILISNARKSLSKPYTKETIGKKKSELENLQTDFKNILEKEELVDPVKFRTRFNELKAEALGLLLEHSESAQQVRDKNTAEQEGKMETSDLKTIVTLIPVFTGKKEDLESFAANLELVYETVPEEKKEFFFKYVFCSRLDSRVKNRVKQKGVPKNITELLSALKAAYKPVKSSNAILNELTGLTQRNNNLQGFANKIESLVSELNEIQISDLGEQCREAIIATNNLTAFNTFLNGLQDQQIVSTIEASRVSTFADALRIAERYVSRTKQKDVMYHNAQTNRDNKNGKKKYYNNGNNNKRYNNNNGNNDSNNNNGYNRNKGNKNNKNNNRNGRNNSNNNNRNNNGNRKNNNNWNNNNHNGNNNRNNNNYNSRDYNVNQVQDQGNFQVPETPRPSSSESTQ